MCVQWQSTHCTKINHKAPPGCILELYFFVSCHAQQKRNQYRFQEWQCIRITQLSLLLPSHSSVSTKDFYLSVLSVQQICKFGSNVMQLCPNSCFSHWLKERLRPSDALVMFVFTITTAPNNGFTTPLQRMETCLHIAEVWRYYEVIDSSEKIQHLKKTVSVCLCILAFSSVGWG